MAGQRQDGVPIAAAAIALGMTAEALRKRLQRGTLDGYKQEGAWFAVLPPQHDRQDTWQDNSSGRQDEASGQMAGRQDTEPIEAAYSGTTPAEVERAIEATAARYVADFAGLYDRISAEVAERYEQTIAAKDETIAELRRRAEAAERERDELRSQASPQPASEAPTILVMTGRPRDSGPLRASGSVSDGCLVGSEWGTPRRRGGRGSVRAADGCMAPLADTH